MNITHYAKTWGPLVVAVLIAVFSFLQGNPIGGAAGVIIPVLSMLLAVLNVFITYKAENIPEGNVILRNLKAWANVLHAGLQALLVLLVGGLGLTELTVQHWSVVVLALIGAASVWLFPNAPKLLAVDGHTGDLVYEPSGR